MTKADLLKNEITRQYRSVRSFALSMGIPYSTLVTALDRGIEGMAYGTVISMCDKLGLNPVDFSPLAQGTGLSAQFLENRVMQSYLKLNEAGRAKALELMEDFSQIEKYRVREEQGLDAESRDAGDSMSEHDGEIRNLAERGRKKRTVQRVGVKGRNEG